MVQVFVYIPQESKEIVKEAMFKAGAGKLGNYQKCSFEYSGEGQFLPLEGSNPAIGTKNQLQHVSEVKVEMICSKTSLSAVIDALKESHPYEEPAYGVIQISDC